MENNDTQKQQQQAQDFIQKLYASLEKDLKNDDGFFVSNFSKQRNFPSAFSAVSSDNLGLLKDFYKKTYEASLQAYISKQASVTFNIMDVVNTYNTILEFIFGNDKHKGAYSALSDLYKKKSQPITNATELIISCESLYNANYKIKNTEDGFYLFDPSLNTINKVEDAGETEEKPYNYMDALNRLLGSSIQTKNVAVSFEIPSDKEKAMFPKPYAHKNMLVTLDDIVKEDSYKLAMTKSTDLHYAGYFNGETFSFSNVSFIGPEQRNYHFLPWSYANHRIVKDLADKYGFSFLVTNPTKFLVDSNGYLVNKITYINNDIAQTTFACMPEPLSGVLSWKNDLSMQSQIALTKEIATYILTQLAFGYDTITTDFFFLENDTREIVHFIENEPDFLKRFAYPSAPNNLVNLEVNDAATFLIDLRTLKLLAENIASTNTFSDSTKYPLFGFENFQVVTDNLMTNLDKVNTNFIPKQLFQYEHGVFTSVGKELITSKSSMYNDWFCDHIKNSGMSVNSSLTIKIMNRFSLFSLVAYYLNM